MPHRVYRIRPALRLRLDEALTDDLLSRQSLQVRDARHFGAKEDWLYLFVEGEEKGMLRADALILEFGERAPDADALHARLKAEEDEAASGLGSIFGDVA